jgi:hypothetical protein
MSERKFMWGGYKFTEKLNRGQRSVVLHLYSLKQEFEARSDSLLREEAAALLLNHESVQAKLEKNT